MRGGKLFQLPVFYNRKEQLFFHLLHFAAHVTNHVVMIGVVKRFLILRVYPKLMPDNQVTIDQQIERIVNGGEAYSEFVFLHSRVQHLNIEMPRHGVYLLKHREPLRGFPVAIIFQILDKFLFYSLFYFHFYPLFVCPRYTS